MLTTQLYRLGAHTSNLRSMSSTIARTAIPITHYRILTKEQPAATARLVAKHSPVDADARHPLVAKDSCGSWGVRGPKRSCQLGAWAGRLRQPRLCGRLATPLMHDVGTLVAVGLGQPPSHWRQARLLRFRPRDPQSLNAGARRSPGPAS